MWAILVSRISTTWKKRTHTAVNSLLARSPQNDSSGEPRTAIDHCPSIAFRQEPVLRTFADKKRLKVWFTDLTCRPRLFCKQRTTKSDLSLTFFPRHMSNASIIIAVNNILPPSNNGVKILSRRIFTRSRRKITTGVSCVRILAKFIYRPLKTSMDFPSKQCHRK